MHAVREQYPGKNVVACLELHTYSSLSKEFLSHYLHSLDEADVQLVYFNPHAIQLKRLPPLSPEQVKEGFGNSGLSVFTDSRALQENLLSMDWNNSVLLLMSSGDYDGMDIARFAGEIVK